MEWKVEILDVHHEIQYLAWKCLKNYQFEFSHEISFEMFEFFTVFALLYPQQ